MALRLSFQASISLSSEETRLCGFLYNRRLPWPPTSNTLLLAPTDHTIVLLGPVSALTASKEGDYRLASFHRLLLRTMPCSHLSPV